MEASWSLPLPATIKTLDDTAERMGGKSHVFVVEALTALYAGGLDAKTVVPVGMIPGDSRAKKKPESKK